MRDTYPKCLLPDLQRHSGSQREEVNNSPHSGRVFLLKKIPHNLEMSQDCFIARGYKLWGL